MTTWAIGDLQGCLDPLQRLLEKIRFDPAVDRLWFCGDLVNRGGQSLETLRLVHSLRACSVVVLGNHDLSLLAIGARTEEEQRRVNPDLQGVLFADDAPELLEWLRLRPLLHADRSLGWMMVHAGLAPKWTTAMAERHAREVEATLHGTDYRKLLRNMYGDKPAWSPRLAGPERDRAIINVFTRLRYCSPKGRIAFEEKGPRHAAGRAVSMVLGARARRARPEGRLRTLVVARAFHRQRRARHRHRCRLGRPPDGAATGHGRVARRAGSRP